ncbi:hypothetical protein ACFMJ1_08875, partial [Acinetobacter baumannii]
LNSLFGKFMIFFVVLFCLLFSVSLFIFLKNFIVHDYSFSENLKSFNNVVIFGVVLLLGINYEKIVSYLELKWN